MTARRCLFLLSADFGEYVTATVMARGQPFATRFALPAQLARYRSPGQGDFAEYTDVAGLERLVDREKPDIAVLCSGYLFAVNRLVAPGALAKLVARLRGMGVALATTDPWLRIWAMRPGSRLTIHSIRKGGVDAAQTRAMTELQRYLEDLLGDVPHLFAVPLSGSDRRWLSVFNPEFGGGCGALGAAHREGATDRWLFVLSREDLAFLAGLDGRAFFTALEARIDELTAVERNHLTFIGPERLGQFLMERMARWQRVAFVPFCDFTAFETAVREARIVAYWNVLSASLLYCLYYGVAPVFFGKGHQAKVCEGLYEHVVENVYCGKPPTMLDLSAPMVTDARTLIDQSGIMGWLDELRRDYARLPTPAQAMEDVIRQHAQR